jgi:hypothetical protein
LTAAREHATAPPKQQSRATPPAQEQQSSETLAIDVKKDADGRQLKIGDCVHLIASNKAIAAKGVIKAVATNAALGPTSEHGKVNHRTHLTCLTDLRASHMDKLVLASWTLARDDGLYCAKNLHLHAMSINTICTNHTTRPLGSAELLLHTTSARLIDYVNALHVLQVKLGHVAVGDIEVMDKWEKAAKSTTFWVANKSQKITVGSSGCNFWSKKAELAGLQVSVPANRVKLVP